ARLRNVVAAGDRILNRRVGQIRVHDADQGNADHGDEDRRQQQGQHDLPAFAGPAGEGALAPLAGGPARRGHQFWGTNTVRLTNVAGRADRAGPAICSSTATATKVGAGLPAGSNANDTATILLPITVDDSRAGGGQ